ncbi:MAG: ribose 5-phosphate isomerase B [Gracilimonas sp.]|uniref:ribose 5-phosphate isomerase B n=1 Tax=Gracilimonas TaxID=649462 RepID=UPI001B15F9D4|nr:ribose 5-phosphate isomerase B [Gracilimonas sp.]MBO6586590.1 ribose 5-phosphate isomerase B [Gracilimonas sp.]MBO6615247.1 ribose 5-phosphate isomerase B [Gracilimonas sp.]
MVIPIASDHAGFPAKEMVKKILEEMGHTPVDYGTHSEDSVDYPDFAVKVSEVVNNGEHEQGILVCGSGQGVCMTANKYPKIRAGLVYSPKAAEMTRLHNNANVMCLPGRELNESEIKEIIEAWFATDFEGGRHERRVNKIESLTQK